MRLGWPERSTWAVGGNGRSENLGMTFCSGGVCSRSKISLISLMVLAPRAEVPWSNEINSLEWPTYRYCAIEPQKHFPEVANRKLRLNETLAGTSAGRRGQGKKHFACTSTARNIFPVTVSRKRRPSTSRSRACPSL